MLSDMWKPPFARAITRICLIVLAALSTAWIAIFVYARNPVWTATVSRGTKANDANAALLEATVRSLTSLRPSRDVRHPESLAKAESIIAAQLESFGYVVTRQDVSYRTHVFHNLIARWGDSASREPIVVGAHLDVAGDPNPGADDNASGVAGVVELARLLALTKPTGPAGAIEFVIFATEEPPAFGGDEMGSAVHAKALAAAGTVPKFMLSLEMIGFYSDELFSQHYPLAVLNAIYPPRGNFIGIIGSPNERALIRRVKATWASAGLVPVVSINAPPSVPGLDFSDHRNYWRQGWPALMVTDTAFERNREYHQAGDTPERLDYLRMSDVVTGLAAVLRAAVAP